MVLRGDAVRASVVEKYGYHGSFFIVLQLVIYRREPWNPIGIFFVVIFGPFGVCLVCCGTEYIHYSVENNSPLTTFLTKDIVMPKMQPFMSFLSRRVYISAQHLLG